jgi:dihydrofolate synthase / folylpolyglutamate synthase
MSQQQASYVEAISYLYSLQKYGIKFGLSKTANLLKAFGNPHKGMRYIHIAGTNGKGSVASMLASILKESGLKVGFYSSPHLVRFTERFQINGEEISREEAGALAEAVKRAVSPEEPPTFFEATTAMALVYFANQATDVAIMEVGMGGRLDATNVIDPLVAVITNISLEHQAFLGPRLLDIAGEKAGIVKPSIDVVTAATQPSVLDLLQSKCKMNRSVLWRVGREFRYRLTGSGLNYYGKDITLKNLELALKGRFQARNGATALGVIELLRNKGLSIPTRAIADGLRRCRWPGRVQVVGTDPTIVLDGAHNPGAMRTLVDAIQSGFEYDRLLLVIGVMADKEIRDILREVVPISDHVIYTRPAYYRAAAPEVLETLGSDLGAHGEIVPLLTQAIERARALARPRDLVLISGSLFTVGEALTHFDPDRYRPDEVPS